MGKVFSSPSRPVVGGTALLLFASMFASIAFATTLAARQAAATTTTTPASDPALTPAIPAPPGVESNLEHPPSWQWRTILGLVLFIVTTTPMLIARMFTRIFVHRIVWWDDYSMILAWVGLLSFIGIMFETLKFGSSTDEWHVSLPNAAHFMELFSKIEIVARLGIFFTKLSILLMYLRYFCPPRTRRTPIFWWSWAVIAFNLLYCVALVLTVLLQCVGRPKVRGQTCINSYAVLVTASIINVVTDVIMLAIPMAGLWRLKMARRRVVGLWIVFAVAGLAVAASVARLAYQIPHAADRNRTAILTNVSLLALAEHAIGIIVGCMPTLPSLYRYIRKRRAPAAAPPSSGGGGGGSPGWLQSFSGGRHRPRRVYHDTTLLPTNADDQREAVEEEVHRGTGKNGGENGGGTSKDGGENGGAISAQRGGGEEEKEDGPAGKVEGESSKAS